MNDFPNGVLLELAGGQDSVYSKLLADIAKGVFISGDRLVTTQLAERYGTSINPVREALKRLEGEGFVTSQKNSGSRVAKFEYSTMRDVFEILQILEPYLLEWFIEERTEEQLNALGSLLDRMKALDPHDFTAFRELDTEFHWEMYRHHYNKSAVTLWQSKKLVLQALHANLAISRTRFEAAIEEHEVILGQLRLGDAEGAYKALMNHILKGGDYWSRIMRK